MPQVIFEALTFWSAVKIAVHAIVRRFVRKLKDWCNQEEKLVLMVAVPILLNGTVV